MKSQCTISDRIYFFFIFLDNNIGNKIMKTLHKYYMRNEIHKTLGELL
jgi:hypothetical protein